MSSERYFKIDPGSVRNGRVCLTGGEFHHLSRVSGFTEGDELMLLDGEGGLYRAEIEKISSQSADLRVVSSRPAREPPPFCLALAVIRAGRMDMAVEKCVEVGLRRIIPFTCRRSVWSGGGEKAAGKVKRLSRKVEAVCKQSGQACFPRVEGLLDFESLLEELDNYQRILLADRDGERMEGREGRAPDERTLGIVGPEGGLTPEEKKLLMDKGVIPVSLGGNRLRSETAAISLVVCMHSGYSW